MTRTQARWRRQSGQHNHAGQRPWPPQAYPDLDTTEAIIRLTSQNLLNALANTSEEDWQGVSIDKMLREANALVRAAAYKKRVEIQNQDTTEAGLDAVKSLVWQAMAKERPDLYRQVNEFLNSKKQDGLEAR